MGVPFVVVEEHCNLLSAFDNLDLRSSNQTAGPGYVEPNAAGSWIVEDGVVCAFDADGFEALGGSFLPAPG